MTRFSTLGKIAQEEGVKEEEEEEEGEGKTGRSSVIQSSIRVNMVRLDSFIYLSREGGGGEPFQGLPGASVIAQKHNTNNCVSVYLCIWVSVYLCLCVSVFVTSQSWNRA